MRHHERLRAWTWVLLVPVLFLLLVVRLLRSDAQQAVSDRAVMTQVAAERAAAAAEAAQHEAARQATLDRRRQLAAECLAHARRATDASLWDGHLVLAVVTGSRCAVACDEVEEAARLANLYELDGLRALRIRIANPPRDRNAGSTGALLREVVVPACAPLLDSFDPDYVVADRDGGVADTGRTEAMRRADGQEWSYRAKDVVRREISGRR